MWSARSSTTARRSAYVCSSRSTATPGSGRASANYSCSSRSPARSLRTAAQASTTSRCCFRSVSTLRAGSPMPAGSSVPLVGLSDHFVSEAIYLSDPDGHGIEIYWDRPREVWEGQVFERMTTLPLDVQSLLGELSDVSAERFSGLPDGAVMGHVHLKVASIPETVAFYRDVLGFELMAQVGEQAAFLAAGGYHHHLGANTWESAGGPRRRRVVRRCATSRSCSPMPRRVTRCWRGSSTPVRSSRRRTTGRACATRRGTSSCLRWWTRRLRQPRSRRRSCAWRRTAGPSCCPGSSSRPGADRPSPSCSHGPGERVT